MLRITNLAVVPGTSVTITLSDMPLINGRVNAFEFCLNEAQEVLFDTAQGVEPVLIEIGTSGTAMPLLTRIGNIFYSDRLILCHEYRIAYGNNGMPVGVPHFINFNTPSCTRAFNPADGTTPAPPTA